MRPFGVSYRRVREEEKGVKPTCVIAKATWVTKTNRTITTAFKGETISQTPSAKRRLLRKTKKKTTNQIRLESKQTEVKNRCQFRVDTDNETRLGEGWG